MRNYQCIKFELAPRNHADVCTEHYGKQGCLQGTTELLSCSFKESFEQPLNCKHDEAEPASFLDLKNKPKTKQKNPESTSRADAALRVAFQGNLITKYLLLSRLFRLKPAALEGSNASLAEVSLRLMIMNYAEDHILLVTSHFHTFFLEFPAQIYFYPFRWNQQLL